MKKLINGYEVDENTVIKFVKNPKRQGFKSYDRYEKYQNSETLGEYFETVEKKYSFADLKYDENKGFLQIFDLENNQVNIKESK